MPFEGVEKIGGDTEDEISSYIENANKCIADAKAKLGNDLFESRLIQAQIDPEGLLSLFKYVVRDGKEEYINFFIKALNDITKSNGKNVEEMFGLVRELKISGEILRGNVIPEGVIDDELPLAA